MFWEVNSYSKSIDNLLNKEVNTEIEIIQNDGIFNAFTLQSFQDVSLRELLDDEDILQDYKDQNKNLTQ